MMWQSVEWTFESEKVLVDTLLSMYLLARFTEQLISPIQVLCSGNGISRFDLDMKQSDAIPDNVKSNRLFHGEVKPRSQNPLRSVEEISPWQFSCSFAAIISITGAQLTMSCSGQTASWMNMLAIAWLRHVQVKTGVEATTQSELISLVLSPQIPV